MAQAPLWTACIPEKVEQGPRRLNRISDPPFFLHFLRSP
jgi:hypothetical protein